MTPEMMFVWMCVVIAATCGTMAVRMICMQWWNS